MRRTFKLFLAVFLLMPFGIHAEQHVAYVVGDAYDLKSGENLLYSETYCSAANNQRVNSENARPESVLVIYRDQEKQLLSRKELNYASGLTSPSFVQENSYSGETVKVTLEGGDLAIRVVDTASGKEKNRLDKQVSLQLPLVIDAGFDEFVRLRWNSLLSGNIEKFQFPLVSHRRLVELRIRSSECSYSPSDHQCFKLQISNWFIRMLAAPIELGYDVDSKKLMRYRGLSNIGDGNGNGLMVDIRYDYQINNPSGICY